VTLTFLEFCELLGVDLTPAQLVFAKVAFDGVEPKDLRGNERAIAYKIFGAVEIIPALARFVVAVAAGARSGKTYLGALRLLHLALVTPLTTLAPGEQAAAIIVAPDMRLARQPLRFALGAVQRTPVLKQLLCRLTTDSFTIERGDGHVVTVEALPATRGGAAIRGRSLVAALCDEFAFFRDESAAVNDQQTHEAISPRIVRGGQLLEVSTTWAEAGLLHKFWVEQFGKPKSVLVAHAPTALMRPSEKDRIEVEYERDPINAAREFGAEFLSIGAGAYFVEVDACVEQSRKVPLAPEPALHAVAAADFAFNSDHSWLFIVRVEDGRAVVADWLEIKPRKGSPLKPSEVVGRFAEVMKRHGVEELHSDGHYKEAIKEALEKHGLRFRASDGGLSGKLKNYSAAQTLIREVKALLPNLPLLLTPLRETTVKPLPGGSLHISHPRRSNKGHGDAAAACVLALAAVAPVIRRGGFRDVGAVGARNVSVLGSQHGIGLDNLRVDSTGTKLIADAAPRYQFANGRRMGGF
jgi:Terminase large subunit, T4likevirus-type, N-terminal